MEPAPFELTSAQRGLLESLSRETGEPIASLIDKALEGLERQVRPGHADSETEESYAEEAAGHPQKPHKPIWELFEEASRTIPDEELDRLPTDLAAQVDHYIYGTPKR
jgi:hypothetical protein